MRGRRFGTGLLILILSASACAGSAGRKAGPSTTAVRAPHVVDVQGGYAFDEEFCATPPLTGTIRYTVRQGAATFELNVGNLPSRSPIAVEWINDTVRGYTVAAFDTDAGGRSESDSLRMFRPGEVKAIGLRLSTADTASSGIGQLRPC